MNWKTAPCWLRSTIRTGRRSPCPTGSTSFGTSPMTRSGPAPNSPSNRSCREPCGGTWVSMTPPGQCQSGLAGCRVRAGRNGKRERSDAPVSGELDHVPRFEDVCLTRWCRIRRPGLAVLLRDLAAIVAGGYHCRAVCDTADARHEEPFGAGRHEVVGPAGGHRGDEVGERLAGDVLLRWRAQVPGVISFVPERLRLAESCYHPGLCRIGWQRRGEYLGIGPDAHRRWRVAGRCGRRGARRTAGIGRGSGPGFARAAG